MHINGEVGELRLLILSSGRGKTCICGGEVTATRTTTRRKVVRATKGEFQYLIESKNQSRKKEANKKQFFICGIVSYKAKE